jgi:ribosomal protein S18 acetylase RimI-like enzyme
MSSPPPEGFTLRALRRQDADAVAEFLADDERFFGREPHIGPGDVRSWWIRTNLEHDSWLLEEDRRSVAGGWLDRLADYAFAAGCVRPGAKGRGLGTWLVDHSESHARTLGFRLLRQITLAEDAWARALLERRGYREARRHYEMAIELDSDPPAPQLPVGLVIDTFRLEEAEAFHDASGESFAEEWGFSPMPFEKWWAMRTSDPAFDPSLWFVVRDGEEIAAIARCEAGRHGGGFVGMLGVREPWRRRGLGLALLYHAFREFRARGYRRVSLGVDATNPTGATRLYEKAGMHVITEEVTFEKELT